MNNSNGSVTVCVPSEGGQPSVQVGCKRSSGDRDRCAGKQYNNLVAFDGRTRVLQVMVSNAGNVAMDGVVRDLVYNPYPEFTAFFVGIWLYFRFQHQN